jgi:hypothetical protein
MSRGRASHPTTRITVAMTARMATYPGLIGGEALTCLGYPDESLSVGPHDSPRGHSTHRALQQRTIESAGNPRQHHRNAGDQPLWVRHTFAERPSEVQVYSAYSASIDQSGRT